MFAISNQHLRIIFAQILSGAPFEVCGLLAGVGGKVQKVFHVPNVSSNPLREYYMDPQTQLEAFNMIEVEHKSLMAIYHSHPPGEREIHLKQTLDNRTIQE